MLYELKDLVRKYDLKITGALHCGAHLAEEAGDYASLGIPVWWVEGNPAVITRLWENTRRFQNQTVIQALITDQDDVLTKFNITNWDGMSSSVFDFGTHTQDSPDTYWVDHIEVPSRTLNWIKQQYTLPNVNFLNIDLQGAELLALRGASDLLPQIDYVYCEVSTGPVYVGGAQLSELDAFLGDEFVRVETNLGMHRGTHGDALYIRRSKIDRIPEPQRFVVVVAVRNAERWIYNCLASIANQDYVNFDVSVIDDVSTDRTGAIARDFCEQHKWDFQQRTEQRYALFNQIDGIRRLDRSNPDDIIVFVDGDDRLAHPGVLTHLADCYATRKLQVHYGSYRSEPYSPTCHPARPYPENTVQNNDYRRFALNGGGILFNHLRTFRYRMFYGFREEDFLDPDGQYFITATDSALMIPAMELARGAVYCCPEVLYVYNSENPQSDWRVRPRQCDSDHAWILNHLPKH